MSYYRSLIQYGSVLDPNVQAFITANGITDSTYINALNTLVLGLKSDGLYSGIQAWWIFYGNATQSKFNFINPVDTDAGYRLTFIGGGTISNNGYLGNGTNAYARTKFYPSLVQNVNSNGMTIISRTNNTPIASDPVEIGCFNVFTQAQLLGLKNGSNFVCRMNGSTISSSNTDAKGIYTGVRQSSSVTKLIKNGSVINNGNSGGNLNYMEVAIMNIFLGIDPYAYGYSNQELTQSIIHTGFSDAQVALLHSKFDAFESALGRKTW